MSDDLVTHFRDARKWLNGGNCCGQKDSAGICAAPACIFGEALQELDKAANEIARLRAEIEAQTKRNFETELRFWEIVDRDGLTGLPSDMWEALAQLVKDRAALATAHKEARQKALKDALHAVIMATCNDTKATQQRVTKAIQALITESEQK